MRGALTEIRGRGAELVVIGNGSVYFAKTFQEDLAIDFPVYTDPSLVTFKAAGLRRDFGAAINTKVVTGAIRALKKGFRQTSTQGDPWQQGGVFVVLPPGEERFGYVSSAAGDHPSNEAVLAALPPLSGAPDARQNS